MAKTGALIAITKIRTRTRRAGVAVVAGLAVFAVLQLGLAVGIETGLGRVRDPLYGCRLARVRDRLNRSPEKPLTVAMVGSSRTRYGFRVGNQDAVWSKALDRPVAAFNFGIDGGGPMTELLTWRRLDNDGVHPDLLLIEVLPALLAGQVPAQDYSAINLPTDRLAWRDLALIKRYSGQSRVGLTRDWLKNWPLPWYTHRASLISLVIPRLLPFGFRLDDAWKVDAAGSMGFIEGGPNPEDRPWIFPRTRHGFDYFFTGFSLAGPQCDALRELMAQCRLKGIPVVLVLMPEGPEFRSWYPPGVLPAVLGWLDQVSHEYNAPVVNAREWFGEDDFRDSHHLLSSGADKFTEKLGRECILPILRRTSN